MKLFCITKDTKCAFLSNYYSGIPTKNPKNPWHKRLIKVVTDSYDIIDSAERNSNRVIVYMTEQTQETGLADQYRALADQEKDIIFGGRRAEYKYYDMAPVIASVLHHPEIQNLHK